MLTRHLRLLVGAGQCQLGTGQRRLRGQQHRLRRRAGLQAQPCCRHRAPALLDVGLREGALRTGGHRAQIAPRRFRQQVQPARFALDRQRVDARLRQAAACVQLAAALQHRGQRQAQLGRIQRPRLPRAEGVFQFHRGHQRRPLRGLVALGGQHRAARIEQAQLRMGVGDAGNRIVQRQGRRAGLRVTRRCGPGHGTGNDPRGQRRASNLHGGTPIRLKARTGRQRRRRSDADRRSEQGSCFRAQAVVDAPQWRTVFLAPQRQDRGGVGQSRQHMTAAMRGLSELVQHAAVIPVSRRTGRWRPMVAMRHIGVGQFMHFSD